jgi:hypothetical protein
VKDKLIPVIVGALLGIWDPPNDLPPPQVLALGSRPTGPAAAAPADLRAALLLLGQEEPGAV